MTVGITFSFSADSLSVVYLCHFMLTLLRTGK